MPLIYLSEIFFEKLVDNILHSTGTYKQHTFMVIILREKSYFEQFCGWRTSKFSDKSNVLVRKNYR